MYTGNIKHTVLIASLCATLSTGCHLFKKSKDNDENKDEQITAKSSVSNILDVRAYHQVETNEFKISIRDIPQDTTLKCRLNDAKSEICANDMLIPVVDGIDAYTLRVQALNGKNTVAVGEARFSVGDDPMGISQKNFASPDSAANYSSDLTLAIDPDHLIDGQSFSNGMPIRRDLVNTIKVRFRKNPECRVELRCSHEDLNTQFAPLCNLADGHQFKPQVMAAGLQYLRITPRCGDRVGEALVLNWYGVSADYKPMALLSTHLITKDRYIFNLARPADCPDTQLSFECKSPSETDFKTCTNSLNNPTTGYEIRPICNGTPYEAVTISSH